MSNDVETIRKAAALMRERAEKASFGPWWAASDGLVWADRPGDPVSGSEQIEDAEHIASWHPTVALAVSNLLQVISWMPSFGDRIDLAAAATLARAYLGEADRA